MNATRKITINDVLAGRARIVYRGRHYRAEWVPHVSQMRLPMPPRGEVMGWGDCGTDSKGRPIGYVFSATCDHPGCEKQIHRGLAYACGDMHGENGFDCERYFCDEHRGNFVREDEERAVQVCDDCARLLREQGWIEDEDEGVLVPKEGE